MQRRDLLLTGLQLGAALGAAAHFPAVAAAAPSEGAAFDAASAGTP